MSNEKEELLVKVMDNELYLREYERLDNKMKSTISILTGEVETQVVEDVVEESTLKICNKNRLLKIIPKSDVVVIEERNFDVNGILESAIIYVYKDGLWFVI